MKKHLILTITSIVFAFSVHAQKNYLPGYIIKQKDTVKGFIDYKQWNQNPSKINFKERINQQATIYSPNEISRFHVANEDYWGATVRIETSPKTLGNLTYESALKFESRTVFLRGLFVGKKSLYFLKDDEARQHFYIDRDNTPELLLYKQYLVDGNITSTKENKKYLGQLALYLNECPDFNSKLSQASYSTRFLRKLFTQYALCTGEKNAVKINDKNSKSERGKDEWIIYAGISSSKYHSDEVIDRPFINELKYPKSKKLSVGVAFNYILPRKRERWALGTELQYTSLLVEGTHRNFRSNQNFITSHTKIGFDYLKLNVLMKNYHSIGPFKLFLEGGVTAGTLIGSTNRRTGEQQFASQNRVFDEPALVGKFERKGEIGFILGTGIDFGPAYLNFRYESTTPSTTVSRLYALVGFKIKR